MIVSTPHPPPLLGRGGEETPLGLRHFSRRCCSRERPNIDVALRTTRRAQCLERQGRASQSAKRLQKTGGRSEIAPLTIIGSQNFVRKFSETLLS
ncbi:MAG: hypothetical protein JWO45_1244 [Spartobacteria bacterium]|nr:hypothetical protein [Spartobacteria bacterium]